MCLSRSGLTRMFGNDVENDIKTIRSIVTEQKHTTQFQRLTMVRQLLKTNQKACNCVLIECMI